MRPRALTPEQERQVVDAYRANPRRGRISELARERNVSFGVIRNAIDRASESEISDSRGTVSVGKP